MTKTKTKNKVDIVEEPQKHLMTYNISGHGTLTKEERDRIMEKFAGHMEQFLAFVLDEYNLTPAEFKVSMGLERDSQEVETVSYEA